jgi:hypothetical protein
MIIAKIMIAKMTRDIFFTVHFGTKLELVSFKSY